MNLNEYESVAQEALFGKAVLAALMSGRKYDVISQMATVQDFLNADPLHAEFCNDFAF
jgi:hypothetical protein